MRSRSRQGAANQGRRERKQGRVGVSTTRKRTTPRRGPGGSMRSQTPQQGRFATEKAYSMSLMDFMGRTRTERDAARGFCLTISPVNGFFTSLPPAIAGFFTRVSFIRPR